MIRTGIAQVTSEQHRCKGEPRKNLPAHIRLGVCKATIRVTLRALARR